MDRISMGAVTIKMIRSTSTTSTNGVTLISESVWFAPVERRDRSIAVADVPRETRPPAPSPETLAPILGRLRKVPLDDVQVLEREIVHLGRKPLHPVDEVVIEDDRGDGRRETGGGGDEGLAHPGGDDADVRGLRHSDALERVHDAPHRSEETDERSGAAGGGEKRKPALELQHLRVRGSNQRARHAPEVVNAGGIAFASFARPSSFELIVELAIARQKESHEGARPELVADPVDFREFLAAAKDLEKRVRVGLRTPQQGPLAEDDGPGYQGEPEQDEEHHERNRTRVQNDLKGVESGYRGRGYSLQESSARLWSV